MTTHDRVASPGGTIRPGTHPHAAPWEELLALLERERIRDPDALPLERSAPEPPERLAGARRTPAPITPTTAAQNRRRLDAAFREVDRRPGACPATTSRTPHQSTRPAITGAGRTLTSTTGQEHT